MKDFDDEGENDINGSAAVEDIDPLNSFSTDDEEEEEEVEKTVAVVEGVSTAEQYKEILLKEEEELEKVAGVLLEEDDIEKKCCEYDNFVKHITTHNLRYQDITPMFVDGTPILIDASSLVTCVMNDSNYCVDNGGQTLHFIYLCERIIELISRKGGTCEIVFFRDKSVILQGVPDLFLAWSVLKIHLMKNTNVIVHEMDSIFSSEFKCYVDEVHPCFIILDFSFIDSFKKYLDEEKANYAEKLFHYYELFALSVGLYCVDICHIELFNNMLYSFVTMHYIKNLYEVMCKDFLQFSELCVEKFSLENSVTSDSDSDNSIIFCDKQENTNKNVRRFIAIKTAKMLIENDTEFFIKNEDLVKAYLFYNAVLESLPLNCRCFDSVKKFGGDIPLVIEKIVKCIGVCLRDSDFNDLDCAPIADLWHGNLFIDVVWCIKSVIDKVSIGSKLENLYNELIKQFNDETGRKLQEFPIFPNHIKEKLIEIKESDTSDLNKDEIGENFSDLKNISGKDLQKPLSNEVKGKIIGENELLQPLGDMIKNFCSDILPAYYTCNLSEYFKHINEVNRGYEEKYHWHTLRPLTDDYERIKDTNKENAGLPMKKQLKLKAQYAHYMALYGSNIEGKALEHEPIIVCDTKKEAGSKKKQKKQGKTTTSKKTIEIIEKNKMKKQKELLDLEKQKFENFIKIYKTNKTGRLGDSKNLEIVNQVLLSISSDEFTGKILFYKMEVLFQLWVDLCRRREGDKDVDLTYLKELFLVIRQLLNSLVKIKSLLTDKQTQKFGKILCNIGFRSIAEKWNLPLDNEQSSISACKLSYIRFQLAHLGPELERKVDGQFDERVTGFIPDPWQKKLFDIVDRGQSALIVAPTSSGKTYASYYCMKKVLKESNEGRVVYVAPTKALVNQVAATIYARFKDKNMPAGMSVYGVFTRDYKHNSMNCQILVTVPECLELLLMSPRRYGWVKSLRYVIFDEVHCLAGQGGGIAWERCLMLIQCPFLALSATIQNPREFWAWMQSIETFKKSLDSNIGTQVHLVVHSDRHNDLIRHIYGQDFKLHHIHPYAYLTKRVLLVHKGVPSHISLAPSETVELYDTMISVCSDDPILLELEPDKYFGNTSTGFIFRQDVKEYENKLRGVLEKWFKEKRNWFTETINRLYEPLSGHESGTKNFTYFKENIVPFIENLRSKNMLPALVFSYNRGYCEVIGEDLGSYYRKKEDDYMSQKKRPLLQLQNYDEDDNIGDDDDERSSKGKKRPTAGKKDERMKRDVSELFPLGLTKCNIAFSLRGKARVDSKDLQFIERRLSRKFNKNHNEINQLRRGLGVHHGGITTVLRASVEMLFRSKFLNVVFATGTLALGIHMPCKTVVILGDSPYLNTLEYHQMSGRSGRRGFDKTGDVIFFGLDTDKMRVLMTSKLPRMSGNFPLTVTTVLRLLVLIKDITENSKKTDESYNATLNRVLTVLNEGLLYQTEKKLKDQMKHFVLFSCQLLMIQRLIDSACQPLLMAGLATHLHYHEPGNLALIYLLRSGILAQICKFTPEGKVSSEACELVMNLLSRLFTRVLLKTNKDGKIEKKLCNSVVILPPLPDYVTEALENYNTEVKVVYRHYFEGFSQHITETMGEDNKLPLSGKVFEGSYNINELYLSDNNQKPTLEMTLAGRSKHNFICSAFAGLSGQTDENLYCQDSLISNIRHQVFTDYKIVPLVDLETPLNGYAYDFYRHGILRSIIEDNGLRSGQDWVHLLDFLLVLKAIETSLDELGMSYPDVKLENGLDKNNLNRCVFETFSQVRKNYECFFNNAYNIRERY